jgi:cytochrome P450
MLDTTRLIVPPAPPVHHRDLPPLRLLVQSARNPCTIWTDDAFDIAFSRNTLFGVESALVNDPQGVRHMLAANAANYVRPAMMPRMFAPVGGRGAFLAEGPEWRRQRRLRCCARCSRCPTPTNATGLPAMSGAT